MSQRKAFVAFALLMAGVQLGCAENKFNRQNFDMIKEGMSTRDEVKMTLGDQYEPISPDQWEYEDEKKHLHATIHFNEQGYVIRKEWMDANSGVWGGAAPGIDEQPQGEKKSQSRSHTTVDKD